LKINDFDVIIGENFVSKNNIEPIKFGQQHITNADLMILWNSDKSVLVVARNSLVSLL